MRSRSTTHVRLLGLAALLLLTLGCTEAPKKDEPPALQSTEELKQAVAAVLHETKTPGAGVVLVSKDQVLWTAGIGMADLAAGREVTPETMFRAGSISKSFVALALLKLQEEGRLRLDDRLHDLVGDVEFTNPWEDTDPLRLVHLLEHTSGFDDVTVREYAASVPASDHRDSLAFDPRPRTSRWRPGRFFSYSNAGYALAGYAVERAGGRLFDRYMGDEIFAPLQMKTATFLLTDAAREKLANGYGADGVTATPYEHILGRSSGALNTTPGELAHLVQMFLNRGTYQGTRLLSPESVDRMETPATGVGAGAGLRTGYGLGNFTTTYKGFRFHGHAGGLTNAFARYGYAPDRGVGYVFMLNALNDPAPERIEKLILAHLTRDWGTPPKATAQVPDDRLQSFTGYYEPHTPRVELSRFAVRLLGLRHVAAENGALRARGLTDEPIALLPTGQDGLFRSEEEPVATMAFVAADGEFYAVTGMPRRTNYRRVPAWWAWGQGAVAAFCMAAMLSAVLFPVVWVPRKLLGRMRGVRHLSVRLLPQLAVFWLAAAAVLFVAGAADRPLDRFGHPTAWSVGFCVLTWLFAGTAAAGLVLAVRARRWDVNRWVRRHALLVSVANVVVAGYLGYWGIIGLRTWA